MKCRAPRIYLQKDLQRYAYYDCYYYDYYYYYPELLGKLQIDLYFCLKFRKEDISVPYRNEDMELHELYYRPVWEWLQELLLDRDLVSQMEWDAQRLFRFDSKTGSWKRFIQKAWSANCWWTIQVLL